MVCIHGGLRRQCETCDLVERLAVAEGNCGSCRHGGDDFASEPTLTYCTHKDGFYNGKLMQKTARCEDWTE